MSYAIIADVHANLEALTAVLDEIDAENIEQIVCLGDVVGYCANPNECVGILAARGVPCVRGNHDTVAAGLAPPVEFGDEARHAILWTEKCLAAPYRHFLAALPPVRVVDARFVAVHGALHPAPNEWGRLRTEADAGDSFVVMRRNYADLRIGFFGHMHRPAAYELRDEQVREIQGTTLDLDPGVFYLINPGSVGQSRDRDARAAYAVFDPQEQTVRFRRVEYDHATTRRKLQHEGLVVERGALWRSASWIKRGLLRTVQQASLKTER